MSFLVTYYTFKDDFSYTYHTFKDDFLFFSEYFATFAPQRGILTS